jgi:signal transduction histidine kinase
LRQVRFLEVVSHQYRASLAAIRSSIDSIGLSLAKSDKANHDRITRIRRSVAQLVEVLETNLARSRLQGPAFRVRLAPATAGSIVIAAHQRSRDLLTGPQIDLHIAPDAADIELAADADMLELAILNVLENAVKYAALKGDSLITLSLDKTTDGIAITVTDHGIGIPEHDLPHVFENSVRGSNAKGADGSGLGLFLVAKIATAHGGSAAVQSREGEGTTVRIALPAGEA